MPNWCHNTLAVHGDKDVLQAFVEQVRTEEQPLSFNAIVPEPSAEELRELETYRSCTMCGATGLLPESETEAAKRGARWYQWMDPAVRADRTCNVCAGSKQELVGMDGWYLWRTREWGCKWDASFDDSGPFLALGQEGANVELSKAAQGVTLTPTVAVFKFDTPWAPPVPVVEAASEQHPELEFVLRYGEPGEGYAGEIKCVAGLRLTEEELDIEEVLAPEEMWF